MLVMRKKCKSVNAVCEIYDDCVQPDRTQEILDRCAEICLSNKLKNMAKLKHKDTA